MQFGCIVYGFGRFAISSSVCRRQSSHSTMSAWIGTNTDFQIPWSQSTKTTMFILPILLIVVEFYVCTGPKFHAVKYNVCVCVSYQLHIIESHLLTHIACNSSVVPFHSILYRQILLTLWFLCECNFLFFLFSAIAELVFCSALSYSLFDSLHFIYIHMIHMNLVRVNNIIRNKNKSNASKEAEKTNVRGGKNDSSNVITWTRSYVRCFCLCAGRQTIDDSRQSMAW